MEVLVTGANGFVGRWLVLELSKKGRRVGACMRRASERQDVFVSWIEERGGRSDLVTCVEFDMESPENPWSSELFQGVKDVFHTAALFRFGLTNERAYEVNVGGGLRVVNWTASLPHLHRLILLCGYRMISDSFRHLSCTSSLADGEKKKLFAHYGAYEASKAMEYVMLRAEAKRLLLPLSVVHPSTVIGDSQTGETTQFIGYAQTVKELFERKLPALLGSERVFLPLLTVDYVAQFMANLPDYPEAEGQEYCLLDQETPKLHDLLRLTGHYIGAKVPSLKIPVGALKIVPKFILGERKETLSFLTEESYDTSASDALAEKMGLQKPAIIPALEKWLGFLVATRFGEQEFTGIP